MVGTPARERTSGHFLRSPPCMRTRISIQASKYAILDSSVCAVRMARHGKRYQDGVRG